MLLPTYLDNGVFFVVEYVDLSNQNLCRLLIISNIMPVVGSLHRVAHVRGLVCFSLAWIHEYIMIMT